MRKWLNFRGMRVSRGRRIIDRGPWDTQDRGTKSATRSGEATSVPADYAVQSDLWSPLMRFGTNSATLGTLSAKFHRGSTALRLPFSFQRERCSR
jgi:hypothetical protein